MTPSTAPDIGSAAHGADVDERLRFDDVAGDLESTGRKRLKPGERRLQILQTLAAMLEQPEPERITTAALAARLSLSEAALYRHFASKAQMFEGREEPLRSAFLRPDSKGRTRRHHAARHRSRHGDRQLRNGNRAIPGALRTTQAQEELTHGMIYYMIW